jgi:hypothetical protein
LDANQGGTTPVSLHETLAHMGTGASAQNQTAGSDQSSPGKDSPANNNTKSDATPIASSSNVSEDRVTMAFNWAIMATSLVLFLYCSHIKGDL